MHQRSISKLLLRNAFSGSSRLSSPISSQQTRRVLDSTPFPKPRNPHKPTTNFHRCFHQSLSNSRTQFITRPNTRELSGPSGDFDQNKEVDMINLKFAEAREEIEMAMESKDTVYFDEEADCARAAVNDVLDMFEALLAKLPEDKKAALQRSMGLKIEQLKAEIQQLND
ncbi:hypothetical protein M0R45_001920 [Rubus argutus]|uniref:Uncharacterized protein n=1 Tax=Rubus argutus TaxID=59490 RepID=A0AAW1VFB6_RUBAR